MRRNSSRTGVLPCEIRVRKKEKELAVSVCLEGVGGSQKEVKTAGGGGMWNMWRSEQSSER